MSDTKQRRGRKDDPLGARCRELATAAGRDPDARVPMVGSDRTMPLWCTYRGQARRERAAQEMDVAGLAAAQPEHFRGSPLTIVGEHEERTIEQMRRCMSVGNVVAGAICADGHLGYAQPVGGVIAYEGQISISGVGFDIACGNLAIRLDVPHAAIAPRARDIAREIATSISFGIGRANGERVDHELFDDQEAWQASGMLDYRAKAIAQLGTVGAGNHYVDLLRDEDGFVWIGVHFGSRGLGHTSATRYLKAAGGRDGIDVPPAIVDETSEIGERYLAAMALAGRYAYAGREWVAERVRRIVGGNVLETVHNHHNYAWRERHGGRDLWVVRKGATPAFPGQRGFVGGSMGDNAVILEGMENELARRGLYSTVHGVGRTFGRKEAKGRFRWEQMTEWLTLRGVTLVGGDLDESPMAYRRLPDVLVHHEQIVRILHTLSPFVVVMAGEGEIDPFKD